MKKKSKSVFSFLNLKSVFLSKNEKKIRSPNGRLKKISKDIWMIDYPVQKNLSQVFKIF